MLRDPVRRYPSTSLTILPPIVKDNLFEDILFLDLWTLQIPGDLICFPTSSASVLLLIFDKSDLFVFNDILNKIWFATFLSEASHHLTLRKNCLAFKSPVFVLTISWMFLQGCCCRLVPKPEGSISYPSSIGNYLMFFCFYLCPNFWISGCDCNLYWIEELSRSNGHMAKHSIPYKEAHSRASVRAYSPQSFYVGWQVLRCRYL